MKTPEVRSVITPLIAAVVIAALAGCLATAPPPAPSQTATGFTFGVIGDLGYSPQEEPLVDNVLADLNRDTSLAFVVHVGDLSSPRFGCTEELWARRLAQFRALAHPLVYTPGDNEWTDCHAPEVPGGDPLERLGKLRTVFFEGDHTLGRRTFALTRQSRSGGAVAKYRENVRWELGGVSRQTRFTNSRRSRGHRRIRAASATSGCSSSWKATPSASRSCWSTATVISSASTGR